MAQNNPPRKVDNRAHLVTPPLTGMKKNNDLSAIPINGFDHLENSRFTEQWELLPRPGSSAINPDAPLTSYIDGIFEASDVGVKHEDPTPDNTPGVHVLYCSKSMSNVVQPSDIGVVIDDLPAAIVGTTAPYYTCCTYWQSENKIVYGTARNSVSGNVEVRGARAVPASLTEPVTLCTVAISASSAGNCISGMAEGSDGKLYFAVYEAGQSTKIYTWDGATVALSYDTGRVGAIASVYAINDPTNANFKIVVAYNGIGVNVPVDHLTIGGAWATKTYPFGNASTSNFGAGCVYHLDNSDYDMLALVWTWDSGAGIVHIKCFIIDPVDMSAWSTRQIDGGNLGGGDSNIGVAPSGGKLYVAWGATRLADRWISRFEDGGPGWTDNYSSMGTLINNLPVGMRTDTEGNVYFWGSFFNHIYKSQGTDLTLPFTDLGTIGIVGTGVGHQSATVMGP